MKQASSSQYAIFILKPVILAAIATLVFLFIINPINSAFKTSETAVSIYIQMVFLGWVFFSAFLLMKADEEWKKTDEAVGKNDFNLFKIEAPKKIASSIILVYLIMVILAITSFWLFHFESYLLGGLIVGVITFIVGITASVLFDLDDPLEGLIVVENIPKDWLKRIKK